VVQVTSPDEAHPSKYTAKIVQVSPVIDPSSGTMEVLAKVIDPAPRLRPGMLVNIDFDRP
jgi:multidrug efflux pump subunit AcrA (membrane-fusion protein)